MGKKFAEYSKFENGLFGSPSNNLSNAMNISMSNTFEAKVKDKESKKYTLIPQAKVCDIGLY